MNSSLNNTDINSPIISSDTSQGTNIPFQNNINYTNEILNRINKSPYFRIIFEPKKCCDNSIYISVYTLSLIDDSNPSNEEQNFLFKAFIKFDSCNCQDFEIRCYTGPHFNLANDYFCSFKIKKEDCCILINCSSDITLKPMTFTIAGNKLEINQETTENCYGSIERLANTCTGFNIRKFYSYNENLFKYQIGIPYQCECESKFCNCENCSCEKCSFDKCCEKKPCENCCECCVRKRYLFKIILDNNLNQCGEFYYISPDQCCKDGFYEIRFPNDANVLMKLLLLGGLFEATLFPYNSLTKDQNGVKSSKKNSSLIYTIIIILIFGIFIKVQSDALN